MRGSTWCYGDRDGYPAGKAGQGRRLLAMAWAASTARAPVVVIPLRQGPVSMSPIQAICFEGEWIPEAVGDPVPDRGTPGGDLVPQPAGQGLIPPIGRAPGFADLNHLVRPQRRSR